MFSWRKIFVIATCLLSFNTVYAQYNTDRLLVSGEIALDNKDYVVAIQHFNNILSNKPYLYRPWFYRGVAKEYLGDYVGAENDLTEAIRLNPYVHEIFNARAESRLSLGKYKDAIADYDKALQISPDEKGYWFNRALAKYRDHDVEHTRTDLEYVIRRWPDMPNSYGLMTETYLNANDTVTASKWLERTLQVNPYDGNSWSILGRLNLQRKNWNMADDAFSKAIHYQPKVVNNYTYRAMTRVNLNKLRLAMDDYDKAIDMNPNNFISHYNRGLLRLSLGDDNRAIQDFNFVLRLEPNNLLALYNRAILLDKTGNYKAAVRDYSRVIAKFPNFWSGLVARAACYRKLGMSNKAELDEFRVFKAQMNKHLGVQPRWSREKLRQVRRMSDIDVEKYDQWVVLDDEVTTPEYKNEYRGEIQNRNVAVDFQPMYMLSFMPYKNGINDYQLIDRDLEKFNSQQKPIYNIFVTCKPEKLNAEQTKKYFGAIEMLSSKISESHSVLEAKKLLLQRSVAYVTTHNFGDAMNDLNDYLNIDSTSELALWQRAVCQYMLLDFEKVGVEEKLQQQKMMDDFAAALELSKDNAYLYYNVATAYVRVKDYAKAIDNYNKAISLNPKLAEAYYNRGLAEIQSLKKVAGLKDLSKAGELGIYDAYAIMKKYSSDK